MSIHPHDDLALRIRITEQLAMARRQVANLRPGDKEMRGHLRQQLDDMLAELRGPGEAPRPFRDSTPGWSMEPAARPAISLEQTRKS